MTDSGRRKERTWEGLHGTVRGEPSVEVLCERGPSDETVAGLGRVAGEH